ncbi:MULTISPECIES: hypothetical protein [unclassified Prochlorococcus]|uniref:hypothetical protein n=1 Tax=unclassified Prochlorococcus TaxID=2627481 RepID=UPI000533830D|nr:MULTISPECIES: hypothetical protein [unclassified Prochlorococcus]KGG28515.1 hypothetical protein EV13_1548 [Prochlorococcus sp. MIT 0702]KGG29285.1 hypothetical protein EV12_0208 [Prochlorococcus sp. MIT 0701]KGG31504.1 hypothetical protein EV14_2235 [Prochlorococcus sp. MIT 0703]
MKEPNSKYNLHSKSKDYFPIRQYRFDSSEHPIIKSRKECKFRLKTILSKQEEQMLEGIINTLQCERRDALRISFYEAVRRGCDAVEPAVRYARRDSKERGHTARDRTLTVALPNSEKKALLELATELDLSEKEVVRLAIIWLEKSFRNGTIDRIHKCRMKSNDDIADKWSKENKGAPPNPKVAKLKEAIDIEKQIRVCLDEEGGTLPVENSYFYPAWKWLGRDLKDRIDYYLARHHLLTLNMLSNWEREILARMLVYDFSWKMAVDTHYEDKREAQRILKLSRADLLKLIKGEVDDQEASRERSIEESKTQRSRTVEQVNKLREDKLTRDERILDSFVKGRAENKPKDSKTNEDDVLRESCSDLINQLDPNYLDDENELS